MRGFIAQLVEHRTGIAEVTGSNSVETLIFFFRLLLSSCLNWKIYSDDHSSLSDMTMLIMFLLLLFQGITRTCKAICNENSVCRPTYT